MPTSTYAALVTEENLTDIIADAAKWNLNVDYLKETMDYAADFGKEVYAILNIVIVKDFKSATFTDMWSEDFLRSWREDGATYGPHFKRVQPVTTTRILHL